MYHVVDNLRNLVYSSCQQVVIRVDFVLKVVAGSCVISMLF